MSAIDSRIVRAKIQTGLPFANQTLTDLNTASPIESVRGNSTRFQFGIFDNSGEVADISGVASLNHKIRASQMEGSTIVAEQTVVAANFDETLDSTTWSNGTKQHVEFDYTNAEMNFDPGGSSRRYWHVLTAILDSGDERTLSAGYYVHHDSNNDAGDPPDSNPGTSITLEEAAAQFLRFTADQTLTTAQKEQAFANLGIPAYDDIDAANVALAIGVPYYDRDLERLHISTA